LPEIAGKVERLTIHNGTGGLDEQRRQTAGDVVATGLKKRAAEGNRGGQSIFGFT
jgi:hypothetical protein